MALVSEQLAPVPGAIWRHDGWVLRHRCESCGAYCYCRLEPPVGWRDRCPSCGAQGDPPTQLKVAAGGKAGVPVLRPAPEDGSKLTAHCYRCGRTIGLKRGRDARGKLIAVLRTHKEKRGGGYCTGSEESPS